MYIENDKKYLEMYVENDKKYVSIDKNNSHVTLFGCSQIILKIQTNFFLVKQWFANLWPAGD